MAGARQAAPRAAVRAVTRDELIAAAHGPGTPQLTAARLAPHLRSPHLPLALLAAVVLARRGDVAPLERLLDRVRTLGASAMDGLGGGDGVRSLLLAVPDLPGPVLTRLDERLRQQEPTPEEEMLVVLLMPMPASAPPQREPVGTRGGAPVGGLSGLAGLAERIARSVHPRLARPRSDRPDDGGGPRDAPSFRDVVAPGGGGDVLRDAVAPSEGDRLRDAVAPEDGESLRDAVAPTDTGTEAAGALDGQVGPEPAGAPPPGETAPPAPLSARRAAPRTRRRTAARTEAARALQYGVELADGTRREHAWAPGEQDLVVRIGAPGPGWKGAAQAFPEQSVDFAQGDGALLTVTVFVDAGGLVPPEQRPLFLPRQGASSEARLPVDVPDGVDEVHCSVLVHQGARLLQSMEVVGPVSDVDRADGAGLRTVHEVNLVSAPAGLDDRPPPEVGLNLQAGPTGTGVLLQAGAPPSVVHLAGIEQFRATIADVLLQALEADDGGAPEPGGPDQVQLLVSLAVQGSLLHQALEHDLRPVAAADHVQVIAPEDEYVPLELVYDYGYPARGAKLCRGWRAALETGTCRCRPRTGEVRTVCPLGFWGLRKTLERQSSSGRSLPPGSFSLFGQRTTTGELRSLSSVLFAASRRVRAVDPRAVSDVEAALSSVPGVTVHVATSWRAWCEAVRTHAPGLLLALPHNEEQQGAHELQIGRLSRLPVGAVTPQHVGAADPPPGPVVLLLGCGTGVADIPWQSAAAAFRRAGASVVIGCTVPVLGRQVSRLSQLLVAELERTGEHGATLGETMLGVRRHLLLEGHSVALALVAFGDADWRLPALAG